MHITTVDLRFLTTRNTTTNLLTVINQTYKTCRPVPQYFNDWATKIIHWAT